MAAPPASPLRGSGPADPGQYYRRLRRERLAGTGFRPAATLDALRRRVALSGARRPRRYAGTFQAPRDMSPEAFAALRLRMVQRFVDAMHAQGYRLCTDHKIRVETGAYPAYDLRDGGPREGSQEYVVTAVFTFPNPKPLSLELPVDLLPPPRPPTSAGGP